MFLWNYELALRLPRFKTCKIHPWRCQLLWHALRLGFPNKGDIITITQKCMDTVRRGERLLKIRLIRNTWCKLWTKSFYFYFGIQYDKGTGGMKKAGLLNIWKECLQPSTYLLLFKNTKHQIYKVLTVKVFAR